MAAAILMGAGAGAWADHFDSTWSANATGSWSNPSLWSTNPVFPNNAFDTFHAIIDSANARVTLDAPITVTDFTLSAGTFTGGQTLTVGSTALWSGGSVIGNGKLKVNGYLELSGGDRILRRFTIDVASSASVSWMGGNIDASDDGGNGGGGIVNNAGLWDDSTDNGWFWGNDQASVFNNSGTYLKSAGSEAFAKQVYAAMNNTGLVDVQAGGIWFTGGGTSSGTFNVAMGAMLLFSDYNQIFAGAGAPTTTFSSTAVIASLGTVAFANDFGHATTTFGGTYDSAWTVIHTDDPAQEGNDGRVTFLSGALVNTGSATLGGLEVVSGSVRFETGQGSISFTSGILAAGVIDTSDDLFFNDITWSGGLIRGEPPPAEGITNVSTGSLSLVGTDFKGLLDLNFCNGIGSHATMAEGELTMARSVLINLEGATFDFTGDGRIVRGDIEDTYADFVNAGLLIKSGGAGISDLYNVKVINDGTVAVESGALVLDGGGDHAGTFLVGPGTALALGQGSGVASHFFRDGSVITADADSDVAIYGHVVFDAGSQADIGRLALDGSLEISGTVNVQHASAHQGGSVLVNAGVFTSTGSISIATGGDGQMDVVSGGTVDNLIGLISPAADSVGTVSVEGVGSSWTTSNLLVIANDGTATLKIKDEGLVQAGTAFIGMSLGSVATVSVTDLNSQFIVDTSLGVGVNGSGSLLVSSAGKVSVEHLFVGDQATGNGYLKVDGAGSEFTSSGVTVIGNNSPGTMILQNSAYASSGTHALIGLGASGVGSALIDNATWDITGVLFLGGAENAGGSGGLRIEGNSSVTADMGVRVWGGSAIEYNGGSFSAGHLELKQSGQVILSPGGDKTLLTRSISIVPFEESVLDLSDNKAIVDYDAILVESVVAEQIRQYIQAGHNGGTWDGEQITTSLGDATEFALGYGDNSVLGYTSFGGYAVDADSVLIKYTYYGDANLDGVVNLRDLMLFANGWQTGSLWTDGDFNYDGFVDASDLGLLARNWQSGDNAPLGVALDSLGLPVAVPEPGTAGSIATLLLMLRRRKRG